MLCSLWDLSSLIRDQTRQWPLDLTSGPLGNSPNSFIYLEDYLKWCLHHIAHAPDSISNVCGGKLKRLLMAFGLPQALLGCFQQTTGKLVWRPARHHLIIISFPFAIAFTSSVTSAVKNLPTMWELQEMWVWSLGWEDPLEEGTATTPVLSPGKSHGREAWRAIVHRVSKRGGHDLAWHSMV